MMLNSKSIGNKISEARKKINLSQAELAQQISISPQAVGKWERGESLPDFLTLSRLAEIFGLDLNFFSDNFQSTSHNSKTTTDSVDQLEATSSSKESGKRLGNWDMSNGNWLDADFSGLKGLKEKLNSSNLKNCKFINADLAGLILKNNYVEICDFSNANLTESKIQNTFLSKNNFTTSSFTNSIFAGCEINKCDFTAANFVGAEFLNTNFQNNKIDKGIWKNTSFKNTALHEVIFDGTMEDCSFENCGFSKVKFQNATILNCFFKNNRKFKKVEFENCKLDKITYAFLKNNQADLSNVTILE